MLDALLNVLNGFTDIPFVELAWSHSPDDKYGVINLDNQLALDADADPVSEKMLTGFVDVFVKKPQDLSTVSDVESALKRLGIWFALNSVQFEDDTGYVHYEWIWRDTTGILFVLYRINFYTPDGEETQIVHYLQIPKAPTTISSRPFGLELIIDHWHPTIVPADSNKNYWAFVRVNVQAENRGFVYDANGNRFNSEQVRYIVDNFGGDLAELLVLITEPDGKTYYATNADEQYLEWGNGKEAQWAVEYGTD